MSEHSFYEDDLHSVFDLDDQSVGVTLDIENSVAFDYVGGGVREPDLSEVGPASTFRDGIPRL
ncbi:MAG TPA: hypothetical protein VIN40_06615 [Candidatus Tyrphobacter sp.]